jgi:hypothetical protein
MIGEICAEIKNYFTYDEDKHIGDWVISNGQISPIIDFPTDYIRIVGSRLNDGVHEKNKNGVFDLVDEEFHGGIWIMSPSKDFLNIVKEISDWKNKYLNVDSQAMSPFTSESFGGYSYSKSAGGDATNGSAASWQSVFASRLNQWRKI